MIEHLVNAPTKPVLPSPKYVPPGPRYVLSLAGCVRRCAAKHGGSTDNANLTLACVECNQHKGSDLASIDPESSLIVALFNPRTDEWDDHFDARGGRIVPRTNVGRVTVTLLRMNAPARVEVREELTAQKRWPGPVATDGSEASE